MGPGQEVEHTSDTLTESTMPNTGRTAGRDLDPRFSTTEFVVEADDFARTALWSRFSMEGDGPGQVTWKSDNSARKVHIGSLADHQVWVDFSWAKLNNKNVMFYNPTSQVVDHQMVREWLTENCPVMKQHGHNRHCDATNFSHCLRFVESR